MTQGIRPVMGKERDHKALNTHSHVHKDWIILGHDGAKQSLKAQGSTFLTHTNTHSLCDGAINV
jgi:hypothetical protein